MATRTRNTMMTFTNSTSNKSKSMTITPGRGRKIFIIKTIKGRTRNNKEELSCLLSIRRS